VYTVFGKKWYRGWAKNRPLRLIVYIFKVSEPICVIFGALQHCFVLKTSVNSIFNTQTQPCTTLQTRHLPPDSSSLSVSISFGWAVQFRRLKLSFCIRSWIAFKPQALGEGDRWVLGAVLFSNSGARAWYQEQLFSHRHKLQRRSKLMVYTLKAFQMKGARIPLSRRAIFDLHSTAGCATFKFDRCQYFENSTLMASHFEGAISKMAHWLKHSDEGCAISKLRRYQFRRYSQLRAVSSQCFLSFWRLSPTKLIKSQEHWQALSTGIAVQLLLKNPQRPAS